MGKAVETDRSVSRIVVMDLTSVVAEHDVLLL